MKMSKQYESVFLERNRSRWIVPFRKCTYSYEDRFSVQLSTCVCVDKIHLSKVKTFRKRLEKLLRTVREIVTPCSVVFVSFLFVPLSELRCTNVVVEIFSAIYKAKKERQSSKWAELGHHKSILPIDLLNSERKNAKITTVLRSIGVFCESAHNRGRNFAHMSGDCERINHLRLQIPLIIMTVSWWQTSWVLSLSQARVYGCIFCCLRILQLLPFHKLVNCYKLLNARIDWATSRCIHM